MRHRTRLFLSGVAASLTLIGASAARADELGAADLPAVPRMYFTFTSTATTHSLCGVGSYPADHAAVAPAWTLTVFAPANATPLYQAHGSTQSVNLCYTVPKGAAAVGNSSWVLSVTASNPLVAASAVIVGDGTWLPGHDQSASTQW